MVVVLGGQDAEPTMITPAQPPRRSSPSAATLVAAAFVLLPLMAGCVATSESEQPTASSRPTATATATPTPTPTTPPERVVGGTAGQNRPFVEFTIGQLVASNPQPASLEIVDALVAGGFDRAAMQVTDDTTRVGSRADSILFSILIEGQCLLGQVADGGVATSIGDVLGTGKCLVGRTVSLD